MGQRDAEHELEKQPDYDRHGDHAGGDLENAPGAEQVGIDAYEQAARHDKAEFWKQNRISPDDKT